MTTVAATEAEIVCSKRDPGEERTGHLAIAKQLLNDVVSRTSVENAYECPLPLSASLEQIELVLKQ